MPTPVRPIDHERDRENALRLLGHAIEKHQTASSQLKAALRFASELGVSLRQLSEATGWSQGIVRQILDRRS